MSSSYGIEPKVEHYGCVIDLLARAGLLEEAMELIGTMPMEPNPCALGALLGGCRIGISFIILKMVNVPVLIFGMSVLNIEYGFIYYNLIIKR